MQRTLQRTLQRALLLLNTMIDFKWPPAWRPFFCAREKRARHLVSAFSASWNCAPTTTRQYAGETPSAFRRTGGQRAVPPILNEPRGAHQSAASAVTATLRAAGAAPSMS